MAMEMNWVCNWNCVVEMPEHGLRGVVAGIDDVGIVERFERVRHHGVTDGFCHQKGRNVVISTVRNTVDRPQPVTGCIWTERNLIAMRFCRSARCLWIERR